MDDLISRQDALDVFGLSEKTRKYGGDHSGYDPMMLYEIQDVLEGLPSVSTEKTGRWIHWASGDDCSECGWSTGRYIPTTKYCPNCGCRMVEPQESDNRRCCNCKYFGEILKDNIHSCNNNKSIFKACLETATGCEKFEPQDEQVGKSDRLKEGDADETCD